MGAHAEPTPLCAKAHCSASFPGDVNVARQRQGRRQWRQLPLSWLWGLYSNVGDRHNSARRFAFSGSPGVNRDVEPVSRPPGTTPGVPGAGRIEAGGGHWADIPG
jgi:hypothetical protein